MTYRNESTFTTGNSRVSNIDYRWKSLRIIGSPRWWWPNHNTIATAPVVQEGEIPATEEMKKLVPTSRICIKGDTIYVYNGREDPIKATYGGDPLTTISVLKQKVIDTFKLKEYAVVEWCGLLSDELLRLEGESVSEDEDDQERPRKCYIHKFSKDIPLIEAVIVDGQPFFIQMKEGSKLDFDLLPEYRDGSKIYRPIEGNSDLCKSYVFKDKEDISYYLKLASKLSANQNFDLIFKLIKTVFMKYVVLDDHYITLLVADIYYSNYQDSFATTHYDFCIGDNGSGKNSILLAFHELAYRNLLATGVSGPNIFTTIGSVEECQCTIGEDEVDNLDNEHDKMNIYKSGYSRGSSRIPKTDLNNGRKQELFHSYCFKIFASESSLDNSKAKGLLDRCFEIPCLIGKPKYNIKKVSEKTKKYEHLANELDKTRKLLFACRMIHHDDTFEEVDMNIFGREAELTEPLIRLFQPTTPDTKKELLPALSKCLNAKRKVRSNSLEAIIYRALGSLTKPTDEDRIENPRIVEEPNAWLIGHSAIAAQVKKNAYGEDIPGQNNVFYCSDLGGKVQHKDIMGKCRDKFRAKRADEGIGTGNGKERALRFSKKDLEAKSIEYDVPNEIDIDHITKTYHSAQIVLTQFF
jgi:hypothetical protein